MPFMLIIFGLVMIIAAYHNTQGVLGQQLKNDMSGVGGFFMWFAGIFIIGAIGYYAPARAASRAFMALVIIAMFIANRGVFAQFSGAFTGNSAPSPTPSTPVTPGANPGNVGNPVQQGTVSPSTMTVQ